MFSFLSWRWWWWEGGRRRGGGGGGEEISSFVEILADSFGDSFGGLKLAWLKISEGELWGMLGISNDTSRILWEILSDSAGILQISCCFGRLIDPAGLFF